MTKATKNKYFISFRNNKTQKENKYKEDIYDFILEQFFLKYYF